MPYENILFTVTGSNAQAQNVSVFINPNGTGSTAFTYTGLASGYDIIQATYAGKGLTSNQVMVTWNPPAPTSFPDGINPPWEYSYFTQSNFTPANNNNANYQTAGNVATFYYGDAGYGAQQDTSIAVGDWIYTQFTYNGTTMGPYYAQVIEIGCLSPPTVVHQFWYYSINVPGGATSVYLPGPNSGGQSGAVTTYTVQKAVVTPPTTSLAGGSPDLVLTPTTQTGTIGNPATVILTISGIDFTQTPYIPLLQGTPGELYISDVPGSPGTFNFPPLPSGGSVNRTAAADLFSLAGDTSGRLSIVPTSTGYQLYYNGAAPDPNVATTAISVTYDEFAWFNANSGQFNTQFDRYAVTSTGGGSTANLQVTWLVTQPSEPYQPGGGYMYQGQPYTTTVTLAEPLPPVQQSATVQFTTTSPTVTVDPIIPIMNAQGFLTGWTITINVGLDAPVNTPGLYVGIELTDVQTYLSGDNFVTNGPLTYYSNAQWFPLEINSAASYPG